MDYSQTNLIWFLLPVTMLFLFCAIVWTTEGIINVFVKVLLGWFTFHGMYLIWTLELL